MVFDIGIYNTSEVVLFAKFDWLFLRISSAIHLLAASGGENGARTAFQIK